MNANELADELIRRESWIGGPRGLLSDSATMLRQLQAENDARRISNKELHEEIWMLKDEAYRLKARLIRFAGREK